MHTIMLSGGLDSVVTLAEVCERVGEENVKAIWVNYGQRLAEKEREAVEWFASYYGVKVEKVVVIPPMVGLGSDVDMRKLRGKTYEEIDVGRERLMVPGRNAWLILIGVNRTWPEGVVYCGVHGKDTPYPDQTREFVKAMKEVVRISTLGRVRFEAPWVEMRKEDIVKRGVELGVPLERTWSCYEGGDVHCGVCPSCLARKEAFLKAGVEDKTEYDG